MNQNYFSVGRKTGFYILIIAIAFLGYGCSSETESAKNYISCNDSTTMPNYSGDYPKIPLPPGADTTSSTWKGIDLSPRPPVKYQSVADQKEDFILQPGYNIDPVLSEPCIKEPAAIKFDGNGRMYVLELRSYMQDIDATDELAPVSRISRWEDTNGDGRYDQGTVFVDSLVFPRFVLPFGPNKVLAMESNTDKIYKYIDTDGNGEADKKELFASGSGLVQTGNVEHQTSFLTWAMDNWLYSTYNPVRIRWTPDGVIKEPTGSPHGQWGVTQDNYGKTWYQGGASGVPESFQFPIKYGNFHVDGQLKEGFRVPYSLVRLADIQPGMSQVKPDGSLGNVTGGAGNDIYRANRLPNEMEGDYFYGEPVGRIIRRVRPEQSEGLTYLSNVYQSENSEFIQSTDPLFRPTDIATAPDGTMYIVDMYRGIIQEGTWTQPGSYLRTKIQQYQMDEVTGRGRIWRLTHKDKGRNTTRPRMFEESSAQLVDHLDHPNGWWRDKAQQLLVLRQDSSVVPALTKMVRNSDNQLARFHALWTLEGLGALQTQMVRNLMKDPNPRIRIQAIRASETLYKYGVTSLEQDYQRLTKDSDTRVVIQALQTLNVLGVPEIEATIDSTLAGNSARGIQVVGKTILDRIAKKQQLANSRFTPEQLELYEQGKAIYDNFCSSCHGSNGLGTPVGEPGGPTIAPPLSGSQRIQGHREYAVKTLLHGMKGPVEDKSYEGIMVPMGENDDKWIASVVSYIRNSMGNEASFVNPEYVKKIRDATSDRTTSYSYDELVEEIPKEIPPQDNWNITASSMADQGVGTTKNPGYAFTTRGWKSEGSQKPGQWFQVELPDPVSITEIQFNSVSDQYPRKYKVEVSRDGEMWKQVATGQGNGKHTTISFQAAQGKLIRLKQTGKAEHPWSMKMLKLYAR